MVRDGNGQTPPVVLQFLIDLLQYNDNLGNKYSDTFYIVSIMNALSHALVAVASKETSMLAGGDQTYMEEVEGNPFLEPAIQEVERYMNTDRLVPSYHNAITVAGIEWKLKLTLACLIPEDRMSFFVYTRCVDLLSVVSALADLAPAGTAIILRCASPHSMRCCCSTRCRTISRSCATCSLCCAKTRLDWFSVVSEKPFLTRCQSWRQFTIWQRRSSCSRRKVPQKKTRTRWRSS